MQEIPISLTGEEWVKRAAGLIGMLTEKLKSSFFGYGKMHNC